MKTMKITVAIIAMLVSGIVSAQSYTVSTEKSNLKWLAKKVTGEHFGEIKLKEGAFEIKGDKMVNGEFIIDMNTITCTDLTDDGYNARLVGHLKSDDFFGVENFPTAKLIVKESSAFDKGMAKVKADLTIKGITNVVNFEVKQVGNDYHAFVTVDRSKYDVRYGSSSFFDNLGDKAIDDEFTLEVTLVIKN